MEKLQDTIDRLFADVDDKPTQQPLPSTAIVRNQAFAEQARKLDALRAARLAKAESIVSRRAKRVAD